MTAQDDAPAPAPISWPDQDIALYCAEGIERGFDKVYFFSLNLRSGQVALQLATDNTITYYSVSPNGRWLEVSTADPARSTWMLYLHDLERNATTTFTFDYSDTAYLYASARYGWSADGQWLAILSSGVLHLIAPEYDYYRTIVPQSPGCIFAAWIDR